MKWLAASLCLILSGCISAKVSLDPRWNAKEKPAYEDYVDYYVFGFVGNPALDLQKICVDQKPYGLQRVKTWEDGLITVFTVGIYSPATVRVWCGD